MPARMTRSAPQSPFELPEVRAVVRATRLSCQNARKAQKFTPVRGSSGESSGQPTPQTHVGDGISRANLRPGEKSAGWIIGGVRVFWSFDRRGVQP